MKRSLLLACGAAWAASVPAAVRAQDAAPISLPSVAAAAPRTLLDRAIAEFKETGVAQTIPAAGPGEFPAYAYGHSRPTLRCAPLAICVVELQPGEELTDQLFPGDPERWAADKTVIGENTVQVLVRAKECDASTNLIIPTNRRRYIVDLEVPPCKKGDTNPKADYMPGIRFWYPEEEAAPTPKPKEPGALDGLTVDLSRVNRDYRWDRSRRVTWSPVWIFDDGVRTYIQLAPEARHGDMPLLYMEADDAARELLSYIPKPDPAGDYLVADRVLKRAVLVLRSGKKEHQLRIVNMAVLRRERGR